MTPDDPELFRGPVAYVTGTYPAVSHTFIQREISALRELGVEVIPCSIRRPPQEVVVGAEQEAEAARCFIVLEAAKWPHKLARAHLGLLFRSPGRWFAAARLAWRIRPPGVRAALWQAFYFAEAGILADFLQHRGVVHLHNHFGDSSGTVALLTSILTVIPFSYTMHGPTLFYEPKKWRLDVKTEYASFVVCISHFSRSQGMLFSDVAHWDKLRIVHCGVFPEDYRSNQRQRYGKQLLFVGRLAAVKGLPVLMEAVGSLRQDHPDLHLTIVGDGADRVMLENLAKKIGLTEAVTFAGYLSQQEVSKCMEAADIFVLPSFAEGVPVVLMEAMASCMPVVATRVGGVEELVVSGETGLLVAPGDVKSLAEAIAALFEDPERCALMGGAGRARVVSEFDVRREAAWLLQLLSGRVAPGRLRPDQGKTASEFQSRN